MEKLLFKDGQTLQVQSITATNGTLRVNVINNSYEQLKHLFTDPLTTGRIAVEGEDGGEAEVFENYTIFSFIRENAGGIFIVEMQQDGEDTDTKLEKLKTDMEKLKEQSNPLINSEQRCPCGSDSGTVHDGRAGYYRERYLSCMGREWGVISKRFLPDTQWKTV